MFNFAYAVALHFYALARIFRCRWKTLGRRLGFGFPKVEGPVIWVHAVSMGEVRAIAPLVRALKERHRVLVSTVTETGYAEIGRSLPEVDYAVYLPFDFPYVIGPIMRRVAPSLVIVCETDLWYNFLRYADAPVVLVNGKISKRSFERFSRFGLVCKRLLGQIDFFCVQDQTYRDRFSRLGIPDEKFCVTGNLKFDALIDATPTALEMERGSGPVVVLGSTHDPEEEKLLKALKPVWKEFPEMRVWVVPRHPQRFQRVARLLRELEIPFHRYSEGGDERVVLLDAVGVLRAAYAQADVAIVAGSFTSRVGGHNILEPLLYDVPLLFGPHMKNQPELERAVLEMGAGRQIELEEVGPEVLRLLCDASQGEVMAKAGRELLTGLRGATDRTLEFLREKGLGGRL